MTFHYQPLIGGDLFDAAERFARECDAKGLVGRDASDREDRLQDLWDKVEGLGWPLSRIAEEAGGVGGTLEDALALVEGAGRFALPIPLANSIVLSPCLLDAEYQAKVAAGTMRPVAILDAAYPWSLQRGSDNCLALEDDRLTGQIWGTEMVPGATHLVVATGSNVAIVAASEVEIRTHTRIDSRPSADISFAGAPVEAILPDDGVNNAIQLGALCACVEIVAGAATVIEDSVAYLNERHQFGVPLSSFQVLRHYVADMFIAYQNAHAVTASAIREAVAETEDASRAIAIAKLRAGEVGRFIAETAIQVHGGMGMTEENRATRIGKRLLMADLELGDRAWQSHVLTRQPELAA